MNKVKQLETIRKHNLELTHQLEEAKFELEYNSKLNAEGYERAKDLIDDLERIKKEWLFSIEELKHQKDKYTDLINDLCEIKKIMTDVGFKIPWYKKIINKLKSL